MILAAKQAFGGMARQCWPYGIFRKDQSLFTRPDYVWIDAASLIQKAVVIDAVRTTR
jgi:hypothetical protein